MKKAASAPFVLVLFLILLALWLVMGSNNAKQKQPGLLKRAWLRFDRLPFIYQLFWFTLISVNLYIILFVK